MQTINQAGLQLIEDFEGLKLKVYKDPVSIPTVGYGHVVRIQDELKVGDTITRERAEDFLKEDLTVAERAVRSAFGAGTLTDNQFSSLVSFGFNLGPENLRKLIKNGLQSVPQRLLLFNRAGGHELPGLVRRRKAERDLFLTPDAPK